MRQLSWRPSNNSTSSSTNLNYLSEGRRSSQSLLLQKDSPPSQPHGGLPPSEPVSRQVLSTLESKMHQTSSRLLRMTDDDRPFTKVSGSAMTRYTVPWFSGDGAWQGAELVPCAHCTPSSPTHPPTITMPRGLFSQRLGI